MADAVSYDRERPAEDLVRDAAQGGSAALAVLHRRYAPRLFRFARRWLDAPAAEEIVQDVFVQIWRRGETFDPERGSLDNWLLRITRTRVLNEMRRRGRRPDPDQDLDGESLPDETALPDESAWEEYRRTAVQCALQSLPESERRALSLAFLDELTHEQVAATLSVPLGTAKTRIRSGLRRLGVSLAPLMALCALFAWLWTRRTEHERELHSRDERALRAMTSSDLAALRMVQPGAPALTGPSALQQLHATYRARAGDGIAVVTYANFAAAPAGQTYVTWAKLSGRWIRLGAARPGPDGHALFVVDRGSDGRAPEALRVDLQPDGASAPGESAFVSWQRSGP